MIKVKAAGIKVQVPLHDVMGWVWCEMHQEVHQSASVLKDGQITGCGMRHWWTLFTTDEGAGEWRDSS